LKRVGDEVSAGDLIVEIEAEKASHEVETPVAGVVRSLVAAEGDELKVGDVLALIETH
jgi:2-oxoglutarate dehydrogenase E2 component (dihydrolipoamide succinyltransferase)